MAVKKKTGGKNPPQKKRSVPKRSAPRKKAAPKKRPKGGLGHEFKKVCLGIAILLAVCLTAAMLADIFINSGTPVAPPVKVAKSGKEKRADKAPDKPGEGRQITPVVGDAPDGRTKKKSPGLKEKNGHRIVYEVFDHHAAPGRDAPAVEPGPDTMPQIAIIIDDIGYDKKVAMGLFDLSPEITFSVLPFSPYGRTLAGRLGKNGAELMLHLPMEPKEYPKINPGPGALLSSMSPDELLDQLRKDIDAVPGAIGVNNHMGSRLTASSAQMNQIFTLLKKNDLFFIDSKTAPDSKGKAAARLFRLRFSQRDIFLDNFQDIDYITGQFRRLINIAQEHGTAIGIGHPYQATLDTLKIELPKLKGQVKVVRASRLVAIPG